MTLVDSSLHCIETYYHDLRVKYVQFFLAQDLSIRSDAIRECGSVLCLGMANLISSYLFAG